MALDGLDPVAAGPASGWATLVTDPVWLDSGGVQAVVRLDGRRLDAVAFGAAGGDLAARRAGEEVEVRAGRVRPLTAESAWSRSRRLVGRLSIDEVGGHRAGALADAANAVHGTLERGAAGLPLTTRALLAGVVLGDDRALPPEVVDDFRAAGLGHLTAVSGQNVAFLLAVAGPALRRLGWRGRVPATLAVLGAFALVVRFEPSVLRAAAMAGIATTATALGRPAEGTRILGLAVTGLVLVDPLLVRSLGFGLSVAASAAILVLAPRISGRLPGPSWLVGPLAVTLAAQVGVAPLLLGRPDGMPAVAVPANLLAVPAAGPLMAWGLTAGLVAGLAPPAAGLLHVPTSALAWWIAGVARWSAGFPLGVVRPGAVAVLGLVAVAPLVLTRGRRPARWAGLVAGAVLLGALAGRASPSPGATALGEVTVWSARSTTALVVDGPVHVDRSLAELRRAGARCVDVIAVRGGGRSAASLVAALLRRCDGAVAVAPAGRAHPGWLALGAGEAVDVGAIRVVNRDGVLAVGRAPPSR
jgi:competence protein ComEC